MKRSELQNPNFRGASNSNLQRLLAGLGVFLLLGNGLTQIRAAPATNSPSKTDFSAFDDVVRGNIFNAKRSRDYVPSDQLDQRREPPSDFLALTGTFMDEKGPRAFFYGNRSEYQKVVKPEDKIADFKVAAVDYSSVTLKSTEATLKSAILSSGFTTF